MPLKKSKPASKKPGKNSAGHTEKLKEFIRGHANDFLSDKNISSIGIGYKQKDGKPTQELAIQFTVDKKVVPGLLESVDTQEIPKSIVVDGVEFPTDVLERSFSKAFRLPPWKPATTLVG